MYTIHLYLFKVYIHIFSKLPLILNLRISCYLLNRSRAARHNSRWYAGIFFIAAYGPVVALYIYWIPYSIMNRGNKA